METNSITSKEYFRTLKIIYLALIAGQVIFSLTVVFLIYTGEFNEDFPEMEKIFFILVPVLVIGGYLGGRMFFKKRLETAILKPGLPEKLADYQSALIIRYALLEGPSMLAFIAYLLTADIFFIVIAGFIIIIFITLRPTVDRMISDLELSYDDAQKVQNPDTLISEMKVS